MTTSIGTASGPLAGLRVIEFAGIGPAPFACMQLSDMGADVVTIDRPDRKPADPTQIVGRGRTVVTADLKDPAARGETLALLDKADVLVEGFRPGVMERLGLGPLDVGASNPRLIYARMTGWGQEGPLARSAGHDINYIAVTGALHAIGTADSGPVPPMNLVGDYGGGSLYLLVGILAALHESRRSGRGQVVDAAITDGVINMMAATAGRSLRGAFDEVRGANLLDGGTPWYGAYETLDGEHVSIGAIEPQFFAEFCRRAELPPALHDAQNDRSRWPEMRDALARLFKSRTQAEWVRVLSGTDACFAEVLPLSRASTHPHNVARRSFVTVAGVNQPAPAPRFSRTPSMIQGPAPLEVVPMGDVSKRWR
ncbi:CaiB/BaiF CoA-transferase family protein [Variovorax sp. J22P168]|uniref:CaiB/BaiF CoA transferase family protein n=1 Tax=Variovorax jilinensis TaxID=3053513 RepID=UPI0025776DF8|nr:CaiB/BaiF CoA-transferase family protein [Variovorax sp. J22P168]MDM0015161.1 CaiB/BaiF CoA-transferase family protein [Variovorax sp. J22P168]